MKIKLSYVFNPFEKIAGVKALILGMIAMLLTFRLCKETGALPLGYFCFDLSAVESTWIIGVCLVIPWLILSFLFYILSLIFSKSKIRFIDVLGTLAFCQSAVAFDTLLYLSPTTRGIVAGDMVFSRALTSFEIAEIIFSIAFSIFCTIWFYILVFNAVKVSCNLKKARLWIIYIIVMTFSFAASTAIQGSISVFYEKHHPSINKNLPAKGDKLSKLEGLWEGEITITATRKESVFLYVTLDKASSMKESVLYIPSQKKKMIFTDAKNGDVPNSIILSNQDRETEYSIRLYKINKASLNFAFIESHRFASLSSEKFNKIKTDSTLLSKLEKTCFEKTQPSFNTEYKLSKQLENPKGILLENATTDSLGIWPIKGDALCTDEENIYRITSRGYSASVPDGTKEEEFYIVIESFDLNLNPQGRQSMKISHEGFILLSGFKIFDEKNLGFVLRKSTSQRGPSDGILYLFDMRGKAFSKFEISSLFEREVPVDFLKTSKGDLYIVSEIRALTDGENHQIIVRKLDKKGNTLVSFESIHKRSSEHSSYFVKKLIELENGNIALAAQIIDFDKDTYKTPEITKIYVLNSELNPIKTFENLKGEFQDMIKSSSGEIVLGITWSISEKEGELYNLNLKFFDSELKEKRLESNFEVKDFSVRSAKLIPLKKSLMSLSYQGLTYWIFDNEGHMVKALAQKDFVAEADKDLLRVSMPNHITSGISYDDNLYLNSSKGGGVFGLQYLLKTEIPKE